MEEAEVEVQEMVVERETVETWAEEEKQEARTEAEAMRWEEEE